MPSARYTLNIKPEDLIPDQPLPQTRKQKVQNWLHYHKGLLIGGALVLLLGSLMVRDLLAIPQYDYTVGVVTSRLLPDTILSQLSEAFTTLADDRDGNGKVAVQVQQYNLQFTDQAGESAVSSITTTTTNRTNAYEQLAAMTRLCGDLASATSFIYLTDDPAGLQDAMSLFCYIDGSTPAEGADDVENMTVPWKDTPAADLELSSLPLANDSELDVQKWMSRYFFGFVVNTESSVYQSEEVQIYRADCERLWERLTGLSGLTEFVRAG